MIYSNESWSAACGPTRGIQPRTPACRCQSLPGLAGRESPNPCWHLPCFPVLWAMTFHLSTRPLPPTASSLSFSSRLFGAAESRRLTDRKPIYDQPLPPRSFSRRIDRHPIPARESQAHAPPFVRNYSLKSVASRHLHAPLPVMDPAAQTNTEPAGASSSGAPAAPAANDASASATPAPTQPAAQPTAQPNAQPNVAPRPAIDPRGRFYQQSLGGSLFAKVKQVSLEAHLAVKSSTCRLRLCLRHFAASSTPDASPSIALFLRSQYTLCRLIS